VLAHYFHTQAFGRQVPHFVWGFDMQFRYALEARLDNIKQPPAAKMFSQ
jgi:hypothetical protein